MIKSIVTGLDGSAESLKGLEQAAFWAQRLDAELRGVFVEDESRFTYFPTYSESEGTIPKPIALTGEELEQAKQEVEAEEEALRNKFNKVIRNLNLKADLRFLRGRVNETLAREARTADLIVLGKRGVNGSPFSHETGPTTDSIIHDALRPVMVVPDTQVNNGPVLIAFDGSRGVQRVLAPSLELIAALNAPVTVLTVKNDAREAEEIQQSLRQYLHPYQLQVVYTVEKKEENISEAILNMANQIKAGLIVMGSFSHTPLKEFFLGSITRKVLAEAPCPVLTMT